MERGEEIAFEREPKGTDSTGFLFSLIATSTITAEFVFIILPMIMKFIKNDSQTVIRIYSISRRTFMIFILLL